jgi:hypothetical protein
VNRNLGFVGIFLEGLCVINARKFEAIINRSVIALDDLGCTRVNYTDSFNEFMTLPDEVGESFQIAS